MDSNKPIEVFMPSVDMMAINLNNGEIMICINKSLFKLKKKNNIIEKTLTREQGDYFVEIISDTMKMKYDEINEKITIGLKDAIK